MEGKVLLIQYLIWVMLLLGQINGYRSCILKEKEALFELKKYLLGETDYSVLPTWTNDTKSDCCRWNGVKCNRTSGRVIGIGFGYLYLKENFLLNLSLLHPFEEVRSLNLSMNRFSGLFDDVEGYKSLRRLRNLEILDLSLNNFNSSIFPFLNAATSLTTLILSWNYMGGPLHVKELKDLKNLELLDLSRNGFNGSIPIQEFTALRKLKALDLSYNDFSGPIELQGVCKLKNIEELDLSKNNLVGQLPSCLTSLTGLRVLDLSSNNLIGRLPSALGNLESLDYLSLFDNNFDGVFSLGSLTNLSKLKVLKLGSTSNSFDPESEMSWKPKFQLSVISESSWKPKFQLSVISLGTCNLGKVPHFLLHQKDLRLVDLSNNNIYGKFPYWLLKNNTKLEVLHLQNNQFTGNIGQGLRSSRALGTLTISNNNLSGVIPSWIGELLELSTLDLSNNSLEGEIPVSLFNISNLRILDLRNNRLSGNIPEFVNPQSISILLLRGNNLTGHIPQQLCGLSNIQLLDLSNNKLIGSIPSCLSSTSFAFGIKDIFYGSYDSGESYGGYIYLYFKSLIEQDQFMKEYDADFHTKIEFATKHRYDAYWGRNLGFLFGLDISENELSGEIPVELGRLLELQSLNLSHNNLSGVIPKSFSGLKNVESLDLSFNRLQGLIPSQLTDLTSLEVFNVSYNNLSGIIPQGRQFDTFETPSYLGNPFLCGKPTNLSCESNNFQETDESTIDMVSFYWSFAAAYVTILVGIFASLSFDSPLSRFWFYIVDAFIYKAKNLLW